MRNMALAISLVMLSMVLGIAIALSAFWLAGATSAPYTFSHGPGCPIGNYDSI